MVKTHLLTFNKVLLFASISMYFGTGWSLIFFSFPIAPQLTTEDYYNHFVPQVEAATQFFTWMTLIMMLCCTIFIIEKWRSPEKWYPIGVFILIIIATLLTTTFIFPYNEKMSTGIQDQTELQEVLGKWMNLNILRVSLWTIQWLLIMAYFFIHEVKYMSNKAKKMEFA